MYLDKKAWFSRRPAAELMQVSSQNEFDTSTPTPDIHQAVSSDLINWSCQLFVTQRTPKTQDGSQDGSEIMPICEIIGMTIHISKAAVYPLRLAPIGAKLFQNAFQTIPKFHFFEAKTIEICVHIEVLPTPRG